MVLISIVIPSYNRSSYLKTTIVSILDQPYSNFEIIVIDDGSTDNTVEVIQKLNDKRIRYFKIENSERGAARNVGLKYALGEYVNFFDSDDLYLPCLAKLAAFIQQHPESSVIYGDIQHISTDGSILKSAPLPYNSFTKNLLHNNFLACGSVFLKREIAVQFPFNEDRRLSSAEDWELWLRIHTQYSFVSFQETVFQQRHHDNRSLRTIDPEKIENRDNYFASLVVGNELLKKYYGARNLNLFIADRFTFIALAWCGVSKLKVFFYWRKAIGTSFHVILRKRFWAVMKKLIFK